jgi:hypothetical protein
MSRLTESPSKTPLTNKASFSRAGLAVRRREAEMEQRRVVKIRA